MDIRDKHILVVNKVYDSPRLCLLSNKKHKLITLSDNHISLVNKVYDPLGCIPIKQYLRIDGTQA